MVENNFSVTLKMNKALEREKLLMDLWSKNATWPNEDYLLEYLYGLQKRGIISHRKGNPNLTENGMNYFLYGRNTQDFVELLNDLGTSQEERIFLANSIKEIIDKPFAYAIIKKATENPDRNKYPSVDLGAYEDIEHGLLFCAGTHIMIDPQIGQKSIEEVIKKLERFGAVIEEDQRKGYESHVLYNVGDTQKELYLIGTDAMEIDHNIYRRKIEPGIFALMMKGNWRNSNEGFSNLFKSLEHYGSFLIDGGFLLTGVPPKVNFKKTGEGLLSYWVHTSGDDRLSPHGLYQKPTKG